jgi:hypothetical protein
VLAGAANADEAAMPRVDVRREALAAQG